MVLRGCLHPLLLLTRRVFSRVGLQSLTLVRTRWHSALHPTVVMMSGGESAPVQLRKTVWSAARRKEEEPGSGLGKACHTTFACHVLCPGSAETSEDAVFWAHLCAGRRIMCPPRWRASRSCRSLWGRQARRPTRSAASFFEQEPDDPHKAPRKPPFPRLADCRNSPTDLLSPLPNLQAPPNGNKG